MLERQVVTGLILLAVKEFQFNGPFLKLEQNVRLLVGADPLFWESGVGTDIWGRQFVFI